jgi:hypothetical protein
LIRQFVTEGLVIVFAGSAIGLVSSHWAMRILVGLIPSDMLVGMPYLDELGLNSRVLAFAAAVVSSCGRTLFANSVTSAVVARDWRRDGAR